MKIHLSVAFATVTLLCGALFVHAGTDNGGGNGGVNNGKGNGKGNSDPNTGSVTSPTCATPCTPAGGYSVTVAGHWKGNGQATIQGSSIGVVTSVTDDSGTVRTLNISNLTIQPNNHFTGSGDIDGSTITITGRLEPKAPDTNGNIKGWRLLATFHDANGTFGALVGAKLATPTTASTVTPPVQNDDHG